VSACPEDATFTRLVEGTLPAGELRALEAHCDGCRDCARTLAELARTITPAEPADGELLGGRYRLIAPLGSGGMGVVYSAFDTQLRRRVAVKRLRDGGTGSERRRARVLREAQLLASLSHPNVLTVHDVGGIDDEVYVVMELVDGWPMSRWIAETAPRPGWRAIVDVYLQAGRGLAAAHQVAVVHRDVKPENILVARAGRVFIGDFGLAGLTGVGDDVPAAPSGGAELTQSGSVLGTPAYMAPEQLDSKSSDALSDQFSFCVSLYESLHGRRPFTGHSTAEIAARVRSRRLPLGRDGVPRAVDRVLSKGLAADPGKRHRSMDHLLRALSQAREWPARRPLISAGAALLIVLGMAVGILRHRNPPPSLLPSPPIATRPVAAPTASRPMSVPVPAPVVAPTATAKSAPRPTSKRVPRREDVGAVARAWALLHPEIDPQLLLDLADRAHDDRDGAACLTALAQMPEKAWPVALADRALRRRASCEMLRGQCERGRRLLEPLDGAETAHTLLLENCPIASLSMVDDRLAAVIAQAEAARYAGNQRGRRKELKRALLGQTEALDLQGCLKGLPPGRACRNRLAALARAYQTLTESFLAAGECQEGAELDVMQSQVRFQSLMPNGGDPALRCRADRISRAYPACATAAEAAERHCLSR
jgi:serine/threonine protein kinase